MTFARYILVTALLLTGAAAEARSPSADPAVAAYQAYRHQVDRLTAAVYREHRQEIDPARLRGRSHGYDLDHIVTVRCAYAAGWTVEAVARVENLRVISARENRSDGARGCRGGFVFNPLLG